MKEIIVFGLSNEIGGVENYLLSLQKQLEQQVRFLFFVEHGENKYAEEIASHQGEVIYIPREAGIPIYAKKLKEMLKQYRRRADTIYLNISNYSHERLLILQAAKRLKYKVIIHSHGAKLNHALSAIHKITHRFIKQLSLRYVDSCFRLAVSQRAGLFLYGNRLFQVLSPGINLRHFTFDPQVREAIRAKYHCEKKFVVGFVGRMVPIKNPEFCIHVISELCDIAGRDEILLMMIGDGPLLESVKQKVKEMNLQEQVMLLGASDRVSQFLQAMDCLIGTSFSEGMPLNIMEAQAAGLPCICAKGRYPQEIAVSSFIQMISLEEGAKAWANALYQLSQEKSVDRAKRLVENASAIEKFDQQKVAQSLFHYILEIENS